MPLIKSASREAVGTNIKEMEAAGHSRAQSIAAALSNARKYGAKFASGGAPFGQSQTAKQLFRDGFLHGTGPGRYDHLPITVEGGAYVVPADHLAAIGQGNSQAGAAILRKMFGSGPYGMGKPNLPSARTTPPRLSLNAPKPRMAAGGEAEGVDIIAANGEYVISPEQIIERFGDLEKGHRALDNWIVKTRKKHIKTLKGLKPPRKD
jgi:hypothetical protein